MKLVTSILRSVRHMATNAVVAVQSVDMRSDTVTRPTHAMKLAMMEADVGDDVYGEDPSVNGTTTHMLGSAHHVDESPCTMSAMHTIDVRSDTVTRPTPAMRVAMSEAEVGDDMYGEDPTVNELQRRCAELFGMEAALFVPTGTMGNLIAILCHCQVRGLEAIVGHKSHILLNEVGGIAQFAGVMVRTVDNKADGTFDMDAVRVCLRPHNDPHQPWTRLICLENTHNFCGGKVLPLTFLKEVHEFAMENELVVHMDGARIMNAATSLGVPVSEILQYSHSVSLCFSKGLAAPVGSIVAGSKQFIDMAVRMRKALGGGMRQAGVLAAAALYSLDHIVPRLAEDHAWAKTIAEAIMSVNNGIVHVDVDGVHTNIITLDVIKPGLTARQLCQRMAAVTQREREELGASIELKMSPIFPQTARILTHNDLTSDMVAMAITKLQYVLKELDQN